MIDMNLLFLEVKFQSGLPIKIGIKVDTRGPGLEVKKLDFHMVYKKDIEDLNRITAQCSNNNITPYDDIDVLHHNFDNSMVAAEGNKIKRSRDEYDGAGPSGEGSSNDVPHAKRIETLPGPRNTKIENGTGQFCGRAKMHVLGTRRAHRGQHGMLPACQAVGNRHAIAFREEGNAMGCHGKLCQGNAMGSQGHASNAKAMPWQAKAMACNGMGCQGHAANLFS
uniref:Uncharacterized protein n=1 Tax=Fagus sylvatica TaxID=28930 RepID=A0A2N9GEL4_FAGSY